MVAFSITSAAMIGIVQCTRRTLMCCDRDELCTSEVYESGFAWQQEWLTFAVACSMSQPTSMVEGCAYTGCFFFFLRGKSQQICQLCLNFVYIHMYIYMYTHMYIYIYLISLARRSNSNFRFRNRNCKWPPTPGLGRL